MLSTFCTIHLMCPRCLNRTNRTELTFASYLTMAIAEREEDEKEVESVRSEGKKLVIIPAIQSCYVPVLCLVLVWESCIEWSSCERRKERKRCWVKMSFWFLFFSSWWCSLSLSGLGSSATCLLIWITSWLMRLTLKSVGGRRGRFRVRHLELLWCKGKRSDWLYQQRRILRLSVQTFKLQQFPTETELCNQDFYAILKECKSKLNIHFEESSTSLRSLSLPNLTSSHRHIPRISKEQTHPCNRDGLQWLAI